MLQWAITNNLGTNENTESFTEEIEYIKKNQTEILELKNIITENFKNSKDGLKRRIEGSEERISELEEKTEIYNQGEKKNDWLKKSEQRLRDL